MEEKEREGEKRNNLMENFGLNYITYCIYAKTLPPPQNFKKL